MEMKEGSIRFADLSMEAFEKWPVWIEHELDDELYEQKDSPEIIARHESDCLVLAEFYMTDETALRGWVRFDGIDVSVINVFASGKHFIFNRRLPEFARVDEAALLTHLGRSVPLFPLRYETQTRVERTGQLLQGVFFLGLLPIEREVWDALSVSRVAVTADVESLRRAVEDSMLRGDCIYVREREGALTRIRTLPWFEL